MDDDTLMTALKTASDVVADLPEHLQAAAFKIACDVILERISPKVLESNDFCDKSDSNQKHKGRAKEDGIKKKKEQKATANFNVGPSAAITRLMDEGFLDEFVNVERIRSHLRDQRGYNYTHDALNMALLRALRKNLVERMMTDEKSYGYRKAPA